MPTVRANGLDTYYERDDFTDPWTKSETVWIQHGYGRSSRHWYHWVPRLAREYCVLRRDLRGHGQSTDPGPAYVWTVEDLLEDMLGFLDAVGLEKVHYVGESVGGILGIAFAARWPERFKSMTLVAAPTAIHPHVQEMFAIGRRNWVTAMGEVGGDGWAMELAQRGNADPNVLNNPGQAQWLLQEWSKTPRHVLQGLARLAAVVDVAPLLPQVKVPTLILAPGNSPITSLGEQVMIRQTIPDARIAVVDRPGHEIYLSSANECIGALLPFLRWAS